MTATLLDGRTLAKELQGDLQNDVATFSARYGAPPRLVVVQVEGDEASERYVRGIRRLCEKTGVDVVVQNFPGDVSQERLDSAIGELGEDASVHGVLIQMPLPAHLSAERAVMRLNYTKDVDGIHPINAGLLAQGRPALVPNTPAGGMALLHRYAIDLEGRRVAMVGRSAIVGRPMASLLLQANATVTMCHSYTRDLAGVVRACDIVVVAVGRAGLVTADMVQPGAVVVDFGINVLPEGGITGDVDFASVVEVARAITPVPGGTGPVTNVMLLRNVLTAAWRQMGG